MVCVVHGEGGQGRDAIYAWGQWPMHACMTVMLGDAACDQVLGIVAADGTQWRIKDFSKLDEESIHSEDSFEAGVAPWWAARRACTVDHACACERLQHLECQHVGLHTGGFA